VSLHVRAFLKCVFLIGCPKQFQKITNRLASILCRTRIEKKMQKYQLLDEDKHFLFYSSYHARRIGYIEPLALGSLGSLQVRLGGTVCRIFEWI
jgi:hypothetical protein